MIAYEILVQTIADWKAGARPSAPSVPPVSGAPEVVEELESGVMDIDDAQTYEEGEYVEGEYAETEYAEADGSGQYGSGQYAEQQQQQYTEASGEADFIEQTYEDDEG